MSGLAPKTNSGDFAKTRYLSPSKKINSEGKLIGVFIEEVPANTAGSVYRKKNNGKDVWEMIYDSQIIGKLVNSSVATNNFDNSLVIKLTIIDSSFGRWQIEFPVRSSWSRAYFQSMYEINPAFDIAIEPVAFKTKENLVRTFFKLFHINPDGGSYQIPYWFTNENPGPVPPLIDIIVKGKPDKDDTARVNYLLHAHESWANSLFAEEKQKAEEFRRKKELEKQQKAAQNPAYGQPQQWGQPQGYQQPPVQQYQQPPVAQPQYQQYAPPVVQQPAQPVYTPPQAQYQQPPAPPVAQPAFGQPVYGQPQPPVQQWQQPPVAQPVAPQQQWGQPQAPAPQPPVQQTFTPPPFPAQTTPPPGAPQGQPMMRPPVIQNPPVQGNGGDEDSLPF